MKFTTIEELNKYREEHGLDWNEPEFDSDQEYTEATVINSENSQKTIYALIPAEDINYEEARKELTITTRYHDWRNTIADSIHEKADNYINGEQEDEDGEPIVFELSSEDIDEYNRQVAAINLYADNDYIRTTKTAQEILEIVEKNSDNI